MKKIFSLALLLVGLVLIAGCGKTKLKDLDADKLLSTEGKYYVYFYREDCTGCQEVKPVIQQYLEAIQEEKWSDKRRLYGFNITTGSGNEEIYRVYTGENGQGTDGKFFVNDVTKWDDLYIASTPALISVTVEDGVANIRYEAQGASVVTQALATHLGVDYTLPENQ